MATSLKQIFTAAGTWTARPAAFTVLLTFLVLWIIFDRASLDFHGIATVITLAMTLLIQRAEHRDTQALHAKLDELLKTQGADRHAITHIDEKEPETIERQRERERRT